MSTKSFFKKDKFYIIRADKAGVFMAKIVSMDGSTANVNSLRRLYYWKGALDITQIAANGVASSGNKFSTQLGESDESIIFNVIEMHPASEKAIKSIQSVKEWTS